MRANYKTHTHQSQSTITSLKEDFTLLLKVEVHTALVGLLVLARPPVPLDRTFPRHVTRRAEGVGYGDVEVNCLRWSARWVGPTGRQADRGLTVITWWPGSGIWPICPVPQGLAEDSIGGQVDH